MQMNSSPIKKLSYQIKLFSKNLCADGSATLCSKSEVMLTVLNCIYLLLWWVNFERSCGSKKHVLFLLPQLNWKGRSDLTLKAQKTNKTFWAISSDIYWKRTFSNEGLITSRFRIFFKTFSIKVAWSLQFLGNLRKNKDFVFLPVPILPGWLNMKG